MIKAYAAFEPGGELKPFDYDPGPLGDQQVEINVEHCGICHSDLSMIDNEWGLSSYPLVPGHEVVGTIGAIGAGVTQLHVGQRVGLGWHSGYCMTCATCMDGDHNLCAQAESTIIGRHGGFADKVRAQAASVIPLPEGLDPVTAGPLFCGGITVFNPMIQSQLSPTARVGVIGIGGLGHLAVQFLNAWGCEVTAFTSSETKRIEALELGAHHTLDSRDIAALVAAAGRFDFLLSTVNVTLNWDAYLGTLKSRGRLHVVGAALEPLRVPAFSLIMAQRSVSGSPVGSPATLAKMLDFAARHGIEPITEDFDFSDINEAIAHLRSGKARYRVVLNQI
ncbi:NAD(P)-dependent alcohol dehydrogenase [Halothiobacillus sp.]|uniref:NADPH-dependent aldehyde reductase Ahr n=1 Tax=Halothiobacillus sp. TaxID=1891311 RepID=UPI002626A9EA|nr:NAD(P)-dependent alcohol dehydrogenase [Halothiobacillus sp.]